MSENIQLPWLPHAHTAKIILNQEPNSADVTSSFIFAFKGEDILLAQVYSRGWDIPGGHRERSETPEETIARELFEECGTSPILMGNLGYIEITLKGEKPPANYPYPFPTSVLQFYWGVVDKVGTPSASMEVGAPQFFSPEEALKLDSIKNHKTMYQQAHQRAQVVAQQLASL